MRVNKATNEEYQELKKFISKSKVFAGKKKNLYKKINNFKKNKDIK
jgi:hypothetical protein